MSRFRIATKSLRPMACRLFADEFRRSTFESVDNALGGEVDLIEFLMEGNRSESFMNAPCDAIYLPRR